MRRSAFGFAPRHPHERHPHASRTPRPPPAWRSPRRPSLRADEPFYLKDGDRVVFYGDSITDQRLYTLYTEAYVVTRFPEMKVDFVHSGWGGDRVTGGGGGPIDVRLDRDVIAYKPTVVTIMLGMNDASYRPFDQKIYDTYTKGYRHIVERLKSELPGVRLTLIRPSPYDDVTRPPNFPGGYNEVLVRYGDFVEALAKETGRDRRRPERPRRRRHPPRPGRRPVARPEAQPGPGPPRQVGPAPHGRRAAQGLACAGDRLGGRHRRGRRLGPGTDRRGEEQQGRDGRQRRRQDHLDGD